jgi:hypothetical protein
MSSTTWDEIYTDWQSTTFEYSQTETQMDELLKIYTKAELNDLFNAQIGSTPNFTRYTIGSVILLLMELLKNNNIDALSATELTTTSLNLPQASLKDIAVTTGTSITAEKIVLLQIGDKTYKVLAEEI